MILKIILMFLLVMAVIGIIGSKFRWPVARSKFCSACGRPRIGRGPCPCGKG